MSEKTLGQVAYESFWAGKVREREYEGSLIPDARSRWESAANSVKAEVEKPLLEEIERLKAELTYEGKYSDGLTHYTCYTCQRYDMVIDGQFPRIEFRYEDQPTEESSVPLIDTQSIYAGIAERLK